MKRFCNSIVVMFIYSLSILSVALGDECETFFPDSNPYSLAVCRVVQVARSEDDCSILNLAGNSPENELRCLSLRAPFDFDSIEVCEHNTAEVRVGDKVVTMPLNPFWCRGAFRYRERDCTSEEGGISGKEAKALCEGLKAADDALSCVNLEFEDRRFKPTMVAACIGNTLWIHNDDKIMSSLWLSLM